MMEKFLWSASTSAYQFEGAYNEDGKGLSIQDVRNSQNGYFKVAMDHYHHVEEDIKLLSELGLKGYRFSISWSRIFPTGEGTVHPKGIQFYQKIVNECKKYQIQPIATLYHDDLPYELYKKGGWKNRKTIDAFVNYCEVLFQYFGHDIAYWQPICEQNLLTIESITKKEKSLQDIFQENHHMFLAQARVFHLFHEMKLPGKIGPALNLVKVYPATSSSDDFDAVQKMEMLRNQMYLDVAVHGRYPSFALYLLKKLNALPVFEKEDEEILQMGTCDYIGFSNYTSVCVSGELAEDYIDQTGMKYGFNIPGMFKIVKNQHLGYTSFESEVDPVGTRLLLRDLYQQYKMPIFMIQRGYGAKESLNENHEIVDDQRIEYLKLQIEQLRLSIEEGIEILGFCTWSAFDVVSTGNGVNKRYGLIYINRENDDLKNLERIPKKSYDWFKKVIATNGKEL